LLKTITDIPKLPTHLSLITQGLLLNLEAYQNIPLHLAVVYLMFSEKTAYVRLADLKLKRYSLDDRSFDPVAGWDCFCIGCNESEFEGRIVVNKLSELAEVINTGVDLNFKCFFHNPPINSTMIREYVYSRNQEITNPIEVLINHYTKAKTGIPYFLVYPYLNLFRDRALMLKDVSKNEIGFIKYDNQNHSLKLKKYKQGKKFIIQHPSLMLNMYNRPWGPWSQMLFFVPPPEFRKHWDFSITEEELVTADHIDNAVDAVGKERPKASFSGSGMVLKFS